MKKQALITGRDFGHRTRHGPAAFGRRVGRRGHRPPRRTARRAAPRNRGGGRRVPHARVRHPRRSGVPCGARRAGADRPAGQQRRSGRRIRAPRPRVDGRLERHDRHQRQGAALRLADRRAQDDRRGRRAHRQHRLDRRHRTLRERRRLLRHQARRARHFAVDARRPALARHQGERSASRHGRDRILGGALPRRPHGCRQRLSGRRAPHGRRHSRSDRMDRTITGAYER